MTPSDGHNYFPCLSSRGKQECWPTIMMDDVRNINPSPRIITGIPAGCAYAYFYLDPFGAVLQASKMWGPVSAFGDFIPSPKRKRLHVIALGPEFNRQVLSDPELFHSTNLMIPGPRDSAQRRLSIGLPSLNGERHAIERPLAMVLFSKAAVEAFHDRLVTVIDSTVQQWPVGQPIDIWTELKDLLLRISSQYLFGTEESARGFEIGCSLHDWLDLSLSPSVTHFRHDLSFTPFRRMLHQAETIERHIQQVIQDVLSGDAVVPDGFSQWIKSHPRPSKQDGQDLLPGQIAILILASLETMVNALSWTLFLLAQHPRIMADLLDELDGTLKGGPPAKDQLDQLPLLDAVIKESLRVLPPFPGVNRKTSREVEVGGIPLKRGQKVICSAYYTHHMPELYPDPEEFRPNRWFHIKANPYEYLPLSAGPRRCIGYFYAMAVMKVALPIILQRFRLTVVPDIRIGRLVGRVMIYPKDGIPMVLHRQDRQFSASPVRGNIHEMVKLPS
jgi:cytochrome P450